MKDLVRSFRFDFWGMLILVYIIAVIGTAAVGIALVLFKNGMSNPAKLAQALLIFVSVLVPFNTLLATIFYILCKVRVYKDGICAPNPFDVWKADCMLWHDIGSVRIKQVFLYKCWIVLSHDNMKSVLIPCQLSDKTGFIKTILEVAGKENAFSMEIVK